MGAWHPLLMPSPVSVLGYSKHLICLGGGTAYRWPVLKEKWTSQVPSISLSQSPRVLKETVTGGH